MQQKDMKAEIKKLTYRALMLFKIALVLIFICFLAVPTNFAGVSRNSGSRFLFSRYLDFNKLVSEGSVFENNKGISSSASLNTSNNFSPISMPAPPAVYTYSDVPGSPITIGGATPCSSPIVRNIVVNDSFTIDDVKLGFNANHSYRGDIRVTLRHPDGTTAIVIASSNDSLNNYDLELDDASSNSINDGNNDNTASPYYDRSSSPSNALSVFDGKNSAGTWQVRICDTYTGADSGTYNRSLLTLNEATPPGPSNGVLVYADSGSGAYKEEISWLTWGGTSLDNGIQEGDQVTYPLPCRAGTLTVTFSNVVNTNPTNASTPPGGPDRFQPTDMETWGGASTFNYYQSTSSTSEALLGHIGPSNSFSFRLTFDMTVNGSSVAPEVIWADAETTNGSGESFSVTTNGSSWRLIENIIGSSYTASGWGTNTLSISKTEGPANSPLNLTEGATQLDMTLSNSSAGGWGFQGFAIGILDPCDRGDAPGYGDPTHSFDLEAANPPGSAGSPAGLDNASGQPYLGSKPPDAERSLSANDNSQGSRPADEDGVVINGTLTTGSTSFTIPASDITVNTGSSSATLHSWIDFDGSGTFDDDEYHSANVPAGTTNGNPSSDLVWNSANGNAPTGMTVGTTYARFRLTTDALTDTDGSNADFRAVAQAVTQALDGEVEDYALMIAESPPSPFVCGPELYQYYRISTGPDVYTLSKYNVATNTYDSLFTTSLQLNAVGYSTNDNFIYGAEIASGGGGDLYRLDANGTLVPLGVTIPVNVYAGDVDDNGIWYGFDGTVTGNTIYVVDTKAASPTVTTRTVTGTFASTADFAFNSADGKLYGLRHTGSGNYDLLVYDPATNLLTNNAVTGDLVGSGGAIGAIWYATDGFIYAHKNPNGIIYRVDPVSRTTVQVGTGPSGLQQNDGAGCRGPSPFPEVDYSDAPTSGTAPSGSGTNAYGDAIHNIVTGIQLGTNIDSDSGSLASANADGDDNDGTPDDEDGVSSFPTLTEGENSYSIPTSSISATGTGTLHSWIDFDGNGTFNSDEHTSVSVSSGTLSGALSWTFSDLMSAGNTFARFRFTSDASVTSSTPSGAASDGEVEDYQVTIDPPALDFGDAPNTFNTNLASDGARHVVDANLYLGATVADSEADAVGTTAAADSDDGDNTDDEDADVSFGRLGFPSVVTGASQYRIPVIQTVNSTGSAATVYAWVDFDGSGTFDADEATTVTIPDGSTGSDFFALEWASIPAGFASAGSQINVRLRITTDSLVDNGGTTIDERSFGLANDGEVEDHVIKVRSVVNVACNVNTLWASRGQASPIYTSLSSVNIGSGTPTDHFDVFQNVALAQAPNGNLFYPEFKNGTESNLIRFDGTNAVNVGTIPVGGLNVIRMDIGSNGIGYFTEGLNLYRFDSNAATVTFTNLGAITNAAGNAVNLTTGGGDLAIFSDGTIFIIDSSGNAFTVDPTTVEAVYRGQVTGAGTIGGITFADDGTLYVGTSIGGTTGALYSTTINPATTSWALTQIGGSSTAYGDLAGCGETTNPFGFDVSAYKSVKLTNDADSNSIVSAGDTVTYTIHYVNEAGSSSTNFQINDQLPAGLTITAAGAQVVTVSGTGTTATANASYTGAAAGALSDLLASSATLGGQGTITVTIPATVDVGASGTLLNQSSATGDGLTVAVPSDNAGQTSDLPAALQAAPFNLTVPASSISQTITAAIDPTAIVLAGLPNVGLVKACTVPADCTTNPQLPDTDLTYEITFTNTGNIAATNLAIVDAVPNDTDFKVGSASASVGSTGLTFVIEYSDDYNAASPGTATWTYTPASGAGGADAGYDRNVKAIRWRVTAGTLSQTSPNNSGSVSFIAKIR